MGHALVETREDHWDRIYSRKPERDLSWHQDEAGSSLDLAARAGVGPGLALIDVGSGTSRFVDGMIARGIRDVTVLDVSKSALDRLEARLATAGIEIKRIIADVTVWTPLRHYDLWHDRAVFHFLVDQTDRTAYLERLDRAVPIGGHAIIATFSPDGPETCSGLPVVRYSPTTLTQTLSAAFEPLAHRLEDHETPSGIVQRFLFNLFRKIR